MNYSILFDLFQIGKEWKYAGKGYGFGLVKIDWNCNSWIDLTIEFICRLYHKLYEIRDIKVTKFFVR